MVVKKFKKQKGELGENRGAMGAGSNVNVTIKEPFYYKEEVTYSTNYHDDFSPRTFVFADLSYIAPFGYYASEFLRC